jgi:hypothetical protein
MRPLARIFTTLALFCVYPEREGFAKDRFRLDVGLTFSRFEQQVKTELGGARGERLVEEFQLGYAQALTYRVWGPLSVGGFLQLDVGKREAARFSGFDATGKTVTTGGVGGSTLELWMGPLLRGEYKLAFAEIGYGAYGARRDDARDDLPASSGAIGGTLRTSAAVAWTFAIGARVPLASFLDLVLRMQYRIRYYDSRGGEPLAGGAVHGTQNFSPFVGVSWRLD